MHHKPDDPFDQSEFFEPAMQAYITPSPPAFPVIYPVSSGWKLTLTVLGLVIVLTSIAGAIYFGYFHKIRDETGRLMLIPICATFLLLGVYCIAVAFLTRVTLYADAIEYREPLRSIRVLRTEIANYRFRTAKSITYLELLLFREEKIRRVSLLFQCDRDFSAWLAGITDADEEQFQASYNEIIEDVTLGNTPEERLARTQLARRWTDALGAISNLLTVAVLFTSQMMLTAILFALPWLAIELTRRFGSAVSVLDGNEVSMRGRIFPVLFMPVVGLLIISLRMSNLEDWIKIITPSLVGGVVMLALLIWIAPKVVSYPVKLVVLVLCFSLYAASTLAIANLYFDNAPPKDVVLDVSGKFIRDIRSGTHYYLLLLPWGTTKPAQEVNVNDDFYQRIQPGQEVCIHNHTGAFGMPWYEVAEETSCSRPFGGPG